MTDIDEIKSRLNIVDIIGSRIQLKKAGRNFKALCPFHNEKTPSFIVSPDRQTFHCFGCGKGGSVIDWVMEYEHVDFTEALETLAEKAGVKLERRDSDTPQNRLKTKIFEVNHLASEYYQYILAKHPLGEKARQYLKGRGISEKTSRTFGLGYSPNSWDGLRKFLHRKGYDEGVLETAGLTVKSSGGGYDRFRGRVMFTLRDHRGNVVGFSGRVLDPAAKDAKYINTSETPVYVKGNVLYGLDVTKPEIQKTGSAIIMEGEFDVISSFQEGIGNVVAIKGSALTDGHVNLLKRFADTLVFALDADVAGDSAARRGIELAEKSGFDMKVVSIPGGKDPDEAVREDAAGFKKAVGNAIPIYDYFINSALSRFDRATASGKKRISGELVPVLNRIENPVVQAHYVKKIAGALDVGEQVITETMKKIRLPDMAAGQTTQPPGVQKDPFNPQEKLELYILALILQTNTSEYYSEMKSNLDLADFKQSGVKRVLEELGSYLENNPKFLIRDFFDILPKELNSLLDQAFLWDISDIIEDDELVSREWMKSVREFRRQVIKRKLKELSGRVEILEQSGSGDSAEELNAKIAGLTEELRSLEKPLQL